MCTYFGVYLSFFRINYGFFWKNNSFTKEAIKADEYLDLLRNEEWFGERTDDALYYEDDEDEDLEEIEDESISEGDQIN